MPIINPANRAHTLFQRGPRHAGIMICIYARSLSPRGNVSLWKASDNAYCSHERRLYLPRNKTDSFSDDVYESRSDLRSPVLAFTIYSGLNTFRPCAGFKFHAAISVRSLRSTSVRVLTIPPSFLYFGRIPFTLFLRQYRNQH